MSRKVLLSANEAVAWSACKAGCAVASAYPGTPSTEILENVAKFKDSISCEWGVNEKVSMEVAIGASIAGARALTAMSLLAAPEGGADPPRRANRCPGSARRRRPSGSSRR